MKQLAGAPLQGWLLDLPINIRLGWKGLPGSNAPAYYEKSELTDIKSFITLAPGSGSFVLAEREPWPEAQFE